MNCLVTRPFECLNMLFYSPFRRPTREHLLLLTFLIAFVLTSLSQADRIGGTTEPTRISGQVSGANHKDLQVFAVPNNPQSTPALPPGAQVVEHVIIILQENRTPDNLFHDEKLIAKGADIATRGLNSKGERIRLTPVAMSAGYDLNHSHHSFVMMYHRGKMDGANFIPVHCGQHCPPHPQFKYVKPSNVLPYFEMAEQYTFADRMFQTNQGASFPAHQFLLAGTSAPTATSNLFAAEDVVGFEHANWDMGCAGPPQTSVRLIDPSGDESRKMFPCFEHPTLTDLLDNRGLTWRYYATAPKSIWTAPNSIQHIRFGADWANVILPQQKKAA
jgi:hypothetical protein